MPLTELVRMFKGKVDEGASTSTDPSSRPDSDCVELVWENGQIMMQGKARKSSNSNNFQIIGPRPEDSRNANCSKVTKFSTMDTVMADFSMPAPCEMNVDQDVDLVPWLNYAMEEPLHNDYTSDFLNELSGVTINDLPADNQLGYCERKSRFQGDSGHDSSVSLKHGITSKVSSSNEKDNRGESSEVPQFLLPFQHSVPRSGISDTSGSNAGNAHHVGSRNSTINPSSLSAFTTLRLQKLDSGSKQSSSSSGLTNFPYFSWPATLSRASHGTVNPSNKLENDDKRCTLSGSNPANSTLGNLDSGCSQKEMFSHNQSTMASANGNSEALPTKPAEEPFSVKQQPSLGEDIATNHRSQNQACDTPMNKVSAGGDRNMEPVIATSSVCSANSAERGSDNPGRNLKRKSRETAESSGPSEEVEEESVGAKKPASARGGSKRSRAAEVHNLSERRRRDRINEKMRALQELIPNCNKADKASMLDEAIEYLKTLQLQVQMLSMGAGMYMQPMMLPPGMQPIHGVHMPPYAPMGLGMGMGMGFGMNILNMNNGVKMVPFQGPHYPVPGTGPTCPGMPGSTLQAFPHPGQGLPISMQQAPIVPPPMSANLLKMPTGLNASNVTRTSNAPHLAPLTEKNDCNSQAIPSSVASNYLNQATNQSTNEGIQPSALCADQSHGVNPSEKNTESSKGKDAMLT